MTVAARALRLPVSGTLAALVDAAERRNPKAPASAFKELSLYLPWLPPTVAEARPTLGITPVDVIPFANADGRQPSFQFGGGAKLTEFGFLMTDAALAVDERPIVHASNRNGLQLEIIAPNLCSFLKIVATVSAKNISRAMTERQVLAQEKQLRSDRKHGAKVTELAELLLAIPGVRDQPPAHVIFAATPQVPLRACSSLDLSRGDDATPIDIVPGAIIDTLVQPLGDLLRQPPREATPEADLDALDRAVTEEARMKVREVVERWRGIDRDLPRGVPTLEDWQRLEKILLRIDMGDAELLAKVRKECARLDRGRDFF